MPFSCLTPHAPPRRALAMLCWAVMLWLSAAAVANADTDGDGIPRDIEESLGLNPDQAETFTLLHQRAMPPGHRDPARFITRVECANAGGDRFVWRLTFAADYPAETSLLQLYLDTDNNPATGRSGHGCEVMLKANRGTGAISAFAPDGVGVIPKRFPLVAVAGPHLYISYDTPLAQADGQSRFRLMVLSESQDPHVGVDSIPYASLRGPPMSERPKLPLLAEVERSIGVEQTFGPRRVDPLLRHPDTIRLPVGDCDLTGFVIKGSEYRTENATCGGTNGRIRATSPVSGRYYPGFVIHDSPGRQAIGIYVAGERRGIAVADADDNDQRLFFLSEPVSLERGDAVELRTLFPAGLTRIEDLVLLSEKPALRLPTYAFSHIEASSERITWISSWPARCRVEFSNGAGFEEPEPRANHRVFPVPDAAAHGSRFRIVATAPDGQVVESAWLMPVSRPDPDLPTPEPGRIPLRLHAPGNTLPTPWPVTCGIPFPRGVLGSPRQLQLVTARGRAVPCQIDVSSRWPDGTVRWILLDFRHRNPTAEYALEYGPDIERREQAIVDSPTLPDLGTLRLTDASGHAHQVRVAGFQQVRPGFLRTEWLARGSIADRSGTPLMAYNLRLHLYPGLPWVRVLATYGNCYEAEEFLRINSLEWILPQVTGNHAFVRQYHDDRYESNRGRGKRFAATVGPIMVRDFWQNYPKAVQVTPAGSRIGLLPSLTADLYDWAHGKTEEHRLFYWFDKGQYRVRQGMSKTQEVWIGLTGAAPQLDRPLYATPPPAWFRDSGVFGEFPLADPQQSLVQAYDLGVAAAMSGYEQSRERNREYGQFNFGDWWGERVINWGNVEYDTQHGFMLHFARTGDYRFFQRAEEAELHNRDIDTVHYHRDAGRIGKVYAHCIGHVGNYYAKSPLDGPHQGTARGGFTVSHTWCEGHTDHFFLTGDQRSLDTARLIADAYNGAYLNAYDFTNCRIPGWHLILSLAVYRATQDPYYLNACRIIVDRVLERQTLEAEHGVPGGGWRRMMVPGHCLCTPAHYGNAGFMVAVLLTGLRHYHQVTGDPEVAEAIHRAAIYLVDDLWVPEVRGFRYTSCPTSSRGPWSNLLLFDGMSYAYRLRPDPRLARVLLAGSMPGISAVTGFGKSFSQRIRVAPHSLGTLQALRDDPPVPAAEFTVAAPTVFSQDLDTHFDASHSVIPQQDPVTLNWDFGDGTTGEGIAPVHRYRKSGHYQVQLTIQDSRTSDTTSKTVHIPPTELVLSAPDSALIVEAETFSAQGGGNVKVAEGRVGASGSIITGWHAAVGHWLEWSLTAPTPGPYKVVIKYASDCANARREILLNGKHPSPGCRDVFFPCTGGYSTHADNWHYLVLGGEDPLVLDLPQGKATLRMVNLGDGLAIDQFLLLPATP